MSLRHTIISMHINTHGTVVQLHPTMNGLQKMVSSYQLFRRSAVAVGCQYEVHFNLRSVLCNSRSNKNKATPSWEGIGWCVQHRRVLFNKLINCNFTSSLLHRSTHTNHEDPGNCERWMSEDVGNPHLYEQHLGWTGYEREGSTKTYWEYLSWSTEGQWQWVYVYGLSFVCCIVYHIYAVFGF